MQCPPELLDRCSLGSELWDADGGGGRILEYAGRCGERGSVSAMLSLTAQIKCDMGLENGWEL